MKKKQKILLIILIGIFILLSVSVKLGLTQEIDNNIYNSVKNIQNNNLTEILKVITNLGGISSLFFITLITTFILFLFKKRKFGIAITLNIVISSITYVILKNILQRPRPVQSLIDERGYSFPSGHSTNNMAFYMLAIYLVHKNIKNKKIKNLICIVLGLIPILIGFSRIYLGVHYFSDVIAGFCLGIICAILFIFYIFDKIK